MEKKCKRKFFPPGSISEVLLRMKLLTFFVFISMAASAAGKYSQQNKLAARDEVTIAAEQLKKEISGTVTDSQGLPLPGVTVLVKGTVTGTITNANGQFKLSVLADAKTLIFSFIGMQSQEISLNGQSIIDVVMKEITLKLDDIVVIGYGIIRKQDLTGSVGLVPVKDLAKAPVSSFAEALAGRVAGVQVNSNDGQPGGGINIIIRGVGSLTQSTSPLFVIDGFPVENLNPATLNPEEIESMTILKDASSTAIYGSRGANGVILIQTKRGKSGKPVVSFSTSTGFQMTPKPIELMSPYEYIKYQTELDPAYASTTAFFANGKTLEDYRNVKGVNFQDYVLRTGTVQNHNLSLRGGNDQTMYSISGSVYNQEGVIINTGLNRYSGRVTIDQAISKKIKAGITANYSGVTQFGQVINQSTASSNNPTAYVLARAWMYRPIVADSNLDHTITGFGLFSINGFNSSVDGYSGRLLPNENLKMDGLEEGIPYNPVSGSSRNTMVSYATRWDYNYKSKYIITATFRADGSSKFVDHWGYFPGVALAWNMQKEDFISKSLPIISTSKLKINLYYSIFLK